MLEFSRPVWLLLLLGLPGIVFLALRMSYASLGPYQKWISLGLRVVIWTLLVCALAGVQFVKLSDRVSVVIARDMSDSIDDAMLPAVAAQIEEARRTMRKDDSLGKVNFGADPLLEFLPVNGVDEQMLSEWETTPKGNFTDISEALQLGIAVFPDNSLNRLVLITDGNENIGSSLVKARIARDNGVELFVVPVGTQTGAEVVLSSFEAPSQASLGETVNIRFVLDSTVATPAQVSLLSNGEFIGKRSINIRQGKDVYELPVQIDRGGFFTYELVVEPELDSIAENNRAYAFSVVEGQPRLLYATGDPNELNFLPATLKSHNIEVDVVPASGIPYNLADFQQYDGIIFSDIAAYDVTDDQMKMVQTLVRDYGRGFLMIGGEKSYGPGGYFETPIEETLPVDMDFRRKKITPSSLVVCLIDKSGSMGTTVNGQTKVDMAKEAAKAVVRLQTERDYVAVMGFDAVGQWIVPPTRGINKEATLELISSMQAGGGTDLYPALKAVHESSQGVDVQIRHIIVFTDGMVAPADFQGLVAAMRKDGYTISTVAFGSDADIPFMKELARMGEGQMYEANSLYDLPKIFTREVFMANKDTINEDIFRARAASDHPLVSAIGWGGSPQLHGYVATSAKDTAQVPLVTHKDDPLLAVWRYGLGKSAAFTSDAKNRWATKWLNWSGYERFWTGVARWIRSDIDSSGVDVQTSISGNEGIIQVSAIGQEGKFINYGNIEARVTDPGVETRSFPMNQVGPGQYECRFPLDDNGNYFINVVQSADDGTGTMVPVSAQAAGLSMSYSPEYRNLVPNDFLLNHLRTSSLAPEGVSLAGLFTEQRQPQRRLEDAWELFTLIALCLWLLDVAARRLVLDWNEWQAAFATVVGGAGVQRARRTSESLAGLLAVKSRSRVRRADDAAQLQQEERRESLSRGAADREQASGRDIQLPVDAPAGEIIAPQTKRQRDQAATALSGLRQKMSARDLPHDRFSGKLADLQKPAAGATGQPPPRTEPPAPKPPSNISGKEMTSRLLERKRKQHDSRKKDD